MDHTRKAILKQNLQLAEIQRTRRGASSTAIVLASSSMADLDIE